MPPFLLALFANPVVALGIGLQALGAGQEAASRKASAQYKSEVERNNAIIAEQNAMDAIRRGQLEAAKHGVRIKQTKGAAAASMAASGIAINVAGELGAKMMEDIAKAGKYDILTIKHNAEMEARRARIQKTEFEASAGLLDMQASSISPFRSALTAGIGAAARADIF